MSESNFANGRICGIDRKFISNYDEYKLLLDEMICPICLKVLLDPIECDKCQAIICDNCYFILKSADKNCFNEGCKGKYIKANKFVREILNNLNIKCCGCGKDNIRYADYLNHIQSCENYLSNPILKKLAIDNFYPMYKSKYIFLPVIVILYFVLFFRFNSIRWWEISSDYRFLLTEGFFIAGMLLYNSQNKDKVLYPLLFKILFGLIIVNCITCLYFRHQSIDVSLLGWFTGSDMTNKNRVENNGYLDNYVMYDSDLRPMEELISSFSQYLS